jgi:hypothetical protein
VKRALREMGALSERQWFAPFQCGPHCGLKDGRTAHCPGCHSVQNDGAYRIQPHGNITRVLERPRP